MSWSVKPAESSDWWFRGGLVAIFLASIALRFWGLERFNTLVFDEVYYVKFAHNYLTQTPFFDGHPPLSKYLIAIGMWIGNRVPIAQDMVNSQSGGTYTTWSYRWLNAFLGSWIPLVVAGIAYQLNQRRSYALIAGAFAAMDGLFLVESRYALNNIHLVLFGLLGQWFLLIAARQSAGRSLLFLTWAGLFFGASISIKWNGLWFLLGACGLWVIAWIVRLATRIASLPAAPHPPESLLFRLTKLNPIVLVACLGLVPAIVYYLIWIPHIQLNPGTNFWQLQQQILTYHENVGSGLKSWLELWFNPNASMKLIHPYCSHWYGWLFMTRPVAYFYQVANSISDPIPSGGATVSTAPDRVIYDVHAMGNPFLWWFSTAAMGLLIWVLVQNCLTWFSLVGAHRSRQQTLGSSLLLHPTEVGIGLFLGVNYAANLLPWTRVSRCIFLYHYMGCAVFATLALAWLVDRWFHSSQSRLHNLAGLTTLLILAAFIFWMPIYLGLPLSPWQYRLRMWFPTWI